MTPDEFIKFSLHLSTKTLVLVLLALRSDVLRAIRDGVKGEPLDSMNEWLRTVHAVTDARPNDEKMLAVMRAQDTAAPYVINIDWRNT